MRNKPSVKVLEAAFPTKGKTLRRLLTSDQAVRDHPAVIAFERECHHGYAPLYLKRLYALNAEIETFGVEYAHHASCDGLSCGSKCFDYLNAGDTYATTIIRFNDGRYRVGDWGTVVERGGYQ